MKIKKKKKKELVVMAGYFKLPFKSELNAQGRNPTLRKKYLLNSSTLKKIMNYVMIHIQNTSYLSLGILIYFLTQNFMRRVEILP